MKQLYPALDIDEGRYVFDSLDKHQSGEIIFGDLWSLMKENQINLTPTSTLNPLQLEKKVISSVVLNKDPFAKEKQDMKVMDTLRKFRRRLEAKNYDILAVYNAYDRNKDQYLSIKEFSKLIKKIDPSLSEQDVESCFKYFDMNGNGGIAFEEFKGAIMRVDLPE
jgi:Ca2+-binding EF-hand superfamily protein